jgi:hypothetical protein
MRTLLSWLLSLAVVPAIVLAVLRLMLTPLYVQAAYRMPGFPPDPFGFSRAERLHWAELDRQYLLNDADITFLAELRFADGSPVYNERELRHMADVKRVVQGALRVGYAAWALLAALWQGERAFGEGEGDA